MEFLVILLVVVAALAYDFRYTRFVYPVAATGITLFIAWNFIDRHGVSSGHQTVSLGFDAPTGLVILFPGLGFLAWLVYTHHRRLHQARPDASRWSRWWRAALLHAAGAGLMVLTVLLAGIAGVLAG